ncbi:leucine-rich repeat protein 1 isoform X2 [Solenopsis invicta]|uniref:leucine-rich repeat protein 1 isoform X2 n=1 Tax=Solenopsis invicta TaxID=13686 RepID=UPI000E33D6CE|nr:leucine-rich repeat protein 1 isoform X2 [Solenopsis invicta]
MIVQRRSQSILAFSKKSTDDDDVCLYLQTRQNKRGTKYQITKNIERVFTKFVDNGKITIRLTQPSHDLIIQSDTIQLKNFLRLLNLIISGHSQRYNSLVKQCTLTSDVSFNSNEFSVGKVKVVVKKKSEYPTLQGFPRTTQELILSGLDRKSFDRQILRLQSLRILDLSGNNICYLPRELGTLPHLQQLLLSQNNLGKSPKSKWAWLEQAAIRHNLHFLDISDNSLTNLPLQIRNLSALVHLKVSKNALTRLPCNIRVLRNLKVLDVAKNNLLYLPASITCLRLQLLNVMENPFINFENFLCDNGEEYKNTTKNIRMQSLVEWSAKSILKSRITYDASTIPYTLVEYLDEAKYCQYCSTACFDSYIKKFMYLTLSCIELKTSVSQSHFKFECYFCSTVCANNYHSH